MLVQSKNLYKLLPIEADGNADAGSVKKLQETFWELHKKYVHMNTFYYTSSYPQR